MKGESHFDVAMIGAGPACLAAALELVDRAPRLRLAVFEQGCSLEQRFCPALPKSACRRCRVCLAICGFGGAGLFSDGKLHRSDEQSSRQAISHLEKLGLPAFPATDEDDREAGRDVAKRVRRQGMSYWGYPSQHVGTDGIVQLSKRLEAFLFSAGVKLEYQTEVSTVKRTCAAGYVLQVAYAGGERRYFARNVLIGTGKGGIARLTSLLPEAGVRVENQAPFVGVRFEFPRAAADSVTAGVFLDPQIGVVIECGVQASSFCTCTGGYVSTYRREGILMLGGASDSHRNADWSNMAILCDRHGRTPAFLPVDWKLQQKRSGYPEDKIIVQRLDDFFSEKRTVLGDSAEGSEWGGNLWALLPRDVCQAISAFIGRLAKHDPEFGRSNNRLMAPAFEPRSTVTWKKSRPENFYLVGDVTGLSAGIVSAAASGVEAAWSILARV